MDIELEKLKYAILTEVPQAILTDIRASEHTEFMRDAFVVQLRGFLWAQQLETIKYPRDWWQAFKERWFPKWLTRRFPVVYTTIDIKAKYPEYMFLPENKAGKHILFTIPDHQ